MLRRLSYGTKLFGTAVLLIGLTIGVTSVSMVLADRIETRLTVLAEVYAPLADELAGIEADALRQALIFERSLGARPPSQAEFERLGRRIDAGLESAAALLEDVARHGLPADDAAALQGLGPRLIGIEKEHDEWEGHVRRVVAGASDPATIARVEAEEDDYASAIDALRASMATHTRDAAARARSDEATLQAVDLALAGLAALLGLALAAVLTAGLVRPVRTLLGGMLRVRSGELETHVESASTDELGQLAEGFNQMVGELVLKERLTETFGRFVDPRIVRDLIDDPAITDAVGQRRPMTVLFSDIAGFTGMSERLPPQTLVKVLNAWLETMSQPIHAERGVIDKYIGDAILAWWGPPFVPGDEAPARAVRAALAKRDRVDAFNDRLDTLLDDDCPAGLRLDLRIGVSSGPVVVGTIGSELARDYTVIGDTVNAGSRLEAACKMYRVRVLVDEATADALGDDFALREVDTVALAGKSTATRIFEPLDRSDWLDAPRRGLADRYTLGLADYRAGRFGSAATHFEQCLQIVPGDGPSETLLARCRKLEALPPTDWDGVWTQTKG